MLTLSQIQARVTNMYTLARMCKLDAENLRHKWEPLANELNRRWANNRRVHPASYYMYAMGCRDALIAELYANDLEFCYVIDGKITSTHKDSCHYSYEEALALMGKPSSYLDQCERGHYWKNTSKRYN